MAGAERPRRQEADWERFDVGVGYSACDLGGLFEAILYLPEFQRSRRGEIRVRDRGEASRSAVFGGPFLPVFKTCWILLADGTSGEVVPCGGCGASAFHGGIECVVHDRDIDPERRDRVYDLGRTGRAGQFDIALDQPDDVDHR